MFKKSSFYSASYNSDQNPVLHAIYITLTNILVLFGDLQKRWILGMGSPDPGRGPARSNIRIFFGPGKGKTSFFCFGEPNK